LILPILTQKFFGNLKEYALAQMEENYLFSGELKNFPEAERVMSLCVFSKSDAHLIQGELYDIPQVAGKPYFCWVLFSHMAGESVQRKHAGELVQRLAKTGAKEIICFHDDCYTLLARFAPEYGINLPFRPVHLSEYLVEYLSRNRTRIKPLNIDIAYNRPCASRFTPEKEHFIDELFELVGVNRVNRVYDRKNALCCGGTKMMIIGEDPKPDQEKNFDDALNAGAGAMVCLCPVCLHSFSATAAERQFPLIFIGDLARMALGEIEVPVK
jgi:Fe-S oxidoreductase